MDFDLSVADRDLIERAEELVLMRGDGDRHTVAAAARASDGRVIIGLDARHFTGGPCAELVVLGRAVTEGVGTLETIVAVGDNGRGILAPCGRCRQVLLDYYPNIRVIMPSGASAHAVPIADLLPRAYQRFTAPVGNGQTPEI